MDKETKNAAFEDKKQQIREKQIELVSKTISNLYFVDIFKSREFCDLFICVRETVATLDDEKLKSDFTDLVLYQMQGQLDLFKGPKFPHSDGFNSSFKALNVAADMIVKDWNSY